MIFLIRNSHFDLYYLYSNTINSDWAKKTKVFLSLERLKPGETHMNMTQLEYFLAICKYNNISKAATQ